MYTVDMLYTHEAPLGATKAARSAPTGPRGLHEAARRRYEDAAMAPRPIMWRKR